MGSPPLGYYFRVHPSAVHKLLSFAFLADGGWLIAELLGCAILLVRSRRRLRLDATTAPLVVLAATVYPMMIVVWHGDAMEIQRHALVAMMILRLALWGAFFIGVDRVALRRGDSRAVSTMG
jgi:hypothetical protein